MIPDDQLQLLLADPLRQEILRTLAPQTCYLVGGAVRDVLIHGRVSPDWDLIVEGPAREAAERLAQRLGGRLVRMGSRRFSTFRVVLADRMLDLCDPAGASLESELTRRDLTINSIALDLQTGELIDPLGGRSDIATSTLRANAPERFVEDPVRALRLVRFALDLPRFTVTGQTLETARSGSRSLDAVAPERVRSELDAVLGRPPDRSLSRLLRESELFPTLWHPGEPPAGERALDSLDAAADCLGEIVEAGADLPPPADLVAMHHALLLTTGHDTSPPELLDALLERGYVTRAIADLARRLVVPIALPGNETDRRVFVDRFGTHWVVAAVLAAPRPPVAARLREQLVRLALSQGPSIHSLEPFLDGHELELEYGVIPGPEMGKLLRSLHREQVKGSIRTMEEARRWVEEQLADRPADDPTSRPGSADSAP